MTDISLRGQFGINNVIIPRGGPKTISALLDFSTVAEIEIDGEIVVATGAIEYLQGVFIDNADNLDSLTILMGITGQRLICPPESQGYFSIMVPNPPKMVATSAIAANKKIPIFFYNVPIQAAVWSAV